MSEKKFEFRIAKVEADQRLDRFLYGRIGQVSKFFLQNLLSANRCRVNGSAQPGGYKLVENDLVEITIDSNAETAMTPEDIALEIVFEDEDLIVVNKPAGMLVHPTFHQKSGTLVNALAFHLNKSNIAEKNSLLNSPFLIPQPSFIRPGIIHRLDRQTSGLMVVAKTERAHSILADHFRRKLVRKTYLAMVDGLVEEQEKTISDPIARDADAKIWRVLPEGKPAETHLKVLRRNSDTTLLQLEPVTGRTNQLRIHCAHIGHPIIGDDKYSGREFARLCLHASELEFWHPKSGQRLEFRVAPSDGSIFSLPVASDLL